MPTRSLVARLRRFRSYSKTSFAAGAASLDLLTVNVNSLKRKGPICEAGKPSLQANQDSIQHAAGTNKFTLTYKQWPKQVAIPTYIPTYIYTFMCQCQTQYTCTQIGNTNSIPLQANSEPYPYSESCVLQETTFNLTLHSEVSCATTNTKPISGKA